MNQRYEYKFVRLGESWWGCRAAAEEEYRNEIRNHAAHGWRLIQVFSPTGGNLGLGEVAKGPLMFQGDHGAVSYRNIKIIPR